MNSHNPFNTGGSGGCTNDFRSADQLVDRIIGDAYHVVKEVYLALGNLTYIYNYLQKYGLIITVDSEDAIKDIPLSIGKFARVYNKSESAGYYFTDYLYVEDDRTGIIPNDSTATGSWVSTKATGSNASFVRIWKYHAVDDGEITIQLPTDLPIVGVQTIYVQGIRQDLNEGFTYNEGDATITLADELEAGNLVTVIIGITDPDMDIDVFSVLRTNDGASNIGTSFGETVEDVLKRVVVSYGEYTEGPVTIKHMHATITYGGKVYKIKPSVSLPYSTSGNTSSSWELTDKSNFTLVSDPGLEERLSSSTKGDGASLVLLESGNTVEQGINALAHLSQYADVYDVIITYGQSNSAGEAILSGDTSGFPAPLPKSLMYDFTDGTIKPIIQNIVSSTGVASSGHAWGAFCNEWYRLSGRGAVVVHCGRGATSIAQLSKGYSTGNSDYYGKMVAAVSAAKARMVVQGLNVGATFMCFHQGETNQQQLTTFDEYGRALLQLFTDVDADVGLTRFCNFTVGCPVNRPEYAWATIQNAQRYVCNSRDKMLTVFDGCPSFLLRDGNVGPEGVHYTQKGYNLMGREGARGLWSCFGAALSNKTNVDLNQYSRDIAPWSRAAHCAASVRWASSTNKWTLLYKDNDTGAWRPANINNVALAEDGNSLEFTVADKAAYWFTMSAGISRNLVQQGFYATAESYNVGTDYKVKVVIYANLSFLLNTVTGEVRALKSSSVPQWLPKIISVSISTPGVAVITHGITQSYPSVTYYGSSDGTLVAANVSVHCPNSATTRVNCSVTVNDQNPWVVVNIPNVLIKPEALSGEGATINVRGIYAPEF